MATIYSNRNDGAGVESYKVPSATSTWAGGVVPVAADQVYVVGRRTTWNSGNVYKWTGTRTCTVASTTGFATNGFFYVVTTDGQIVKVNYTGITSTTFTNCSIDATYMLGWDNSNSSYIANGYYVHNPAGILDINGVTFECNEMIIQEGGQVVIRNGGQLILNQGIIVRDGRLLGQSGNILIRRPSSALSSGTIGYLSCENYQLSVVDIDGGEVRTYATTTSPIAIGDHSIAINTPTNGTFAWGDDIAVYDYNQTRYRNKGYTGYRDASANFGDDSDEGLDVVGYASNQLYVALRNGARGDVKSVGADYIEVFCDNLMFNEGDKVITSATASGFSWGVVTKVEDSEYTLYDYDFQNPSTNLNDFFVNDDTTPRSDGWTKDANGVYCSVSGYRELVHKYVWERDIIVETEMSPLSQYSTGTRGTTDFGILTSYDIGQRYIRSYDSFKTDILRIDDASPHISWYQRAMSNYVNNRLDRNTSFRTSLREPATYKINCSKAKSVIHINGSEFNTEFYRNGNFKGSVGVFVDSNTNFRLKRLTIKVPTQKIYFTPSSALSMQTGARVWRTGIEKPKSSGVKVVKIASINTGSGNHVDLAFAYRGQYGNGEWPIIKGVNSTTSAGTSSIFLHNHDSNIDYYYDLGAGLNKYIVIDLTKQQTFTHVSFQPRTSDESANSGFNGYKGVAVYGSNDNVNWTTLYGPTDDTKKWFSGTYNRMAFYDLGGARTYRYVKFETDGSQATTNYNRYVNVGVHNFTGGFKLGLNNASDFNVGDYITVMSDSGHSWLSREYEAYFALISAAGANPETYLHGGWMPRAQIVSKSGNDIFLDKPIWWGYVEGRDSVTVMKLNRNFTIGGQITVGSNSQTNWRWPNVTTSGGSNLARIYKFRNVYFDKIGSYRYSSSTSFNRGITVYSYDYWNAVTFDGCVHMMGPDGTTWVGIGSQYAHAVFRNNVVIGMHTGYWTYYASSHTGNAYWNNKILGTILGFYSDGSKAFDFSYNEIATCDSGVYMSAFRVNRMTIPMTSQIKRNQVKGTSNIAYRLYLDQPTAISYSYIDAEANRARATDDYSFQGWAVSSPMKDFDALAEHTGSRMSRYRNEGHFAVGDTSTDLQTNALLKNYGRYGIDLASSLYHVIEREHKNPNEIKIYSSNGDSGMALIGIELDVLKNVPFEIDVYLEYRYPMMTRLQDDGTDDGRLRFLQLQKGTQTGIQYGAVPSTLTDAWTSFSGTFVYNPKIGPAAIYLNKSSQNGYFAVRNAYAIVRTDNPNDLVIRVNTFNFDMIWNPYQENRGFIRPLAGTRTVKMNKLRF